MENIWPYAEVLLPSLGVGLIFWLAMRAIFRADRAERRAEAAVRQDRAAEPAPAQNDTVETSQAEGPPEDERD